MNECRLISDKSGNVAVIAQPSGIKYFLAVSEDPDSPGRWVETRLVYYHDELLDLSLRASFGTRGAAAVGAAQTARVALGIERPHGYRSARTKRGEVVTVAF